MEPKKKRAAFVPHYEAAITEDVFYEKKKMIKKEQKEKEEKKEENKGSCKREQMYIKLSDQVPVMKNN